MRMMGVSQNGRSQATILAVEGAHTLQQATHPPIFYNLDNFKGRPDVGIFLGPRGPLIVPSIPVRPVPSVRPQEKSRSPLQPYTNM